MIDINSDHAPDCPRRQKPLAADWLSQFGPKDMKPRRSETIILPVHEP